MSDGTGIPILDSIANITIQDVLKYQADRNQLKISQGVAKSQNLVSELQAQAGLLTSQVQALAQAKSAQSGTFTDANGNVKGVWLVGGGLAAVALLWYLAK